MQRHNRRLKHAVRQDTTKNLNQNLSYLDLEMYDLIPLWICILFYNFGGQLKQSNMKLIQPFK